MVALAKTVVGVKLRASLVKRITRLNDSHYMNATGQVCRRRKTGPTSPILRTCSFCCAKPMQECTTMGGRKRKFHQQRRAPQFGRR
jgi:hypothetical protein